MSPGGYSILIKNQSFLLFYRGLRGLAPLRFMFLYKKSGFFVMKVEVTCFATLREYSPKGGYLEIDEGAQVIDVIDKLRINKDDVKVIFVNGTHAKLGTPLKDGDRVGLFPAVGGG